MMRFVLPLLLVVCSIVAGVAQNVQQATQGGDQFLDGIGETALVARYAFNGNAEDASRNQFHAALHGGAPVFLA
ncbi:MAG: hypothetical protein IT185_07365, partial [Acidobacteria bacterium]|nr:hypothetical protein [Acidobacteriota bacterium]